MAEGFGEVFGVGGGVVGDKRFFVLLGRRWGNWRRCAFHGGLRVGWAGESTVPAIFSIFWILLQGKVKKFGTWCFLAGRGIGSIVSGRGN